MADSKKKYSLIQVDSQKSPENCDHSHIDEEEIFYVGADPAFQIDSERHELTGRAFKDLSQPHIKEQNSTPGSQAGSSFTDSDRLGNSEQFQDEDPVPFPKLQLAIIVFLIVLIVVFFIYFNFLR